MKTSGNKNTKKKKTNWMRFREMNTNCEIGETETVVREEDELGI